MAEPRLKAEADGYIPFRTRFLAWWHGLEPDALVKGPAPLTKPEPSAIYISDEGGLTEAEQRRARRDLRQRIWGDGCLEPGGGEYTVHLVKPAAPSPDKTVLDLAAGLCGGTHAVAERYGIWIDAMEPDPELLAAATEYCERKGLTSKIRLSGYDSTSFTLKKKRYDCIFARERFHMFADKPSALRTVSEGLKPGGQFVFTDLVLADRGAGGDAVARWRDVLGARPFLWCLEEYKQNLAEHKLDVRIFADETDEFRSHVLQGWSELVDNLGGGSAARPLVDTLMTEAELWLRLDQALASGQLRFLRVHAIQHGNKMRLMSDA